MEQLQYVKSLGLKVNETHRGNCPFCGGVNTFTATNFGNRFKWNCYKASCTIAGDASKVLSTEELSYVVGRDNDTEADVLRPFTVPDYFTSVISTPKALDYVKGFHCLSAFQDGRADIRYDVKRDRVAFIIRHGEEVVDAVGRALTRGVKPKWLRYGKAHYPFICAAASSEQTSTKILVEDCASACAVSGAGTGIGLLGTALLEEYIPSIVSEATRIVIALDKDAGKKAFDIQRELSYYVDTKVWLIPDDIKYLDQKFIKKKVSEL